MSESRHSASSEAFDWLRRLDFRSEQFPEIVRVQTGYSGSTVFELRWDSESAILKVTAATSDAVALERARREFRFYEKLASQLPVPTPTRLASGDDPGNGIALLLSYVPCDNPKTLNKCEDWTAIAQALAVFHARFWGQVELARREMPWLRPEKSPHRAEPVRSALAAWRRIRSRNSAVAASLPESLAHRYIEISKEFLDRF